MAWWCPTCKQMVPNETVTTEEYHETCGKFLGDCQGLTEDELIDNAVDYLLERGLTPEDYEKAWKLNCKK